MVRPRSCARLALRTPSAMISKPSPEAAATSAAATVSNVLVGTEPCDRGPGLSACGVDEATFYVRAGLIT